MNIGIFSNEHPFNIIPLTRLFFVVADNALLVLLQGPDLKKLEKASPIHGVMEGPVASFLVQERQNAIRLMHVVKSALGSLRRVLDGTSLLTTEVEKTAMAMLNHEVRL